MNVSGDAQGGRGSFKAFSNLSNFDIESMHSTENLNYYYIIRYLDSLPAAKCYQEIREDLYHIKGK